MSDGNDESDYALDESASENDALSLGLLNDHLQLLLGILEVLPTHLPFCLCYDDDDHAFYDGGDDDDGDDGLALSEELLA